METKTGNTWAPFCMRCNHARKGDKDKCHVCSYPLETICLGCGTSPDQGEHECQVTTIPANPLAVQNSQLRTEVELSHKSLKMFRDSLANVAKQRDAAKEIAESANLQNDYLKGEIVKVKTMCAEWENRTLNPSQVESIWGICHNALTMHKTNNKQNSPHDHSDPSSPCDMLCMEESECICPGDGKIAPFCSVHGLPMSGH